MRWIVASAVLVLFAWWLAAGEEPFVPALERGTEGLPRADAAVQGAALDAPDALRAEGRDVVLAEAEIVARDMVRHEAADASAEPKTDLVSAAEEDVRDASPEVVFAVEENARRTIAYDSYDDELLSFYRHELELSDEDLAILADATQRLAAQTSGQVVPRPEDGETYGNYQAVIGRYRAEVRAHLGDDRFARVVEFQRIFTAAAPDRFGTEHGVPFERF